MSVSQRRAPHLVAAILFFATLLVMVLQSNVAYAANGLTGRSLTLQNGASAGGSQTSGVVNHLFTFTVTAVETIKSIQFQYCTNADIDIGGTCTTPNGLSTASATLGSPNGGFTGITDTTNGSPYVANAAGVTTTANEQLQVQLGTVTNQDATNCGGTANCTFYVRITTYSSATPIAANELDYGTVAASTSSQIVLTGTMPESLIFCTGQSITMGGNNIPNCATATSGAITFTKLFSTTAAVFATSQMAASTNASQGYAITVSAPPFTSGTNSIPGTNQAANAAETDASTVGTSVWGMNLVADSDAAGLTPASANITTASDGVNYWGIAHTNFSTANSFAFTDTTHTPGFLNNIAGSDYSAGGPTGTEKPTDGQIYTATYMVNAAANQPAGTYTTTLTYICTATF